LGVKIVLCDIGGLRADHVGCYGYQRPTTPSLDSLAAEGLLCEAAFASDATTSGARAALFSGRFGLDNGIVTDGATADTIAGHTPIAEQGPNAAYPLLQEHLAARGVHTAAITPFGRQPARWFYTGWHELHDPWATRLPHEVLAGDVNDLALPWLQANAARDFFLYLSYNNLYAHIDAPLDERATEYWEEFAALPAPAHPDEAQFAAHRELHAAFAPRVQRVPTREAVWKMIHSYDARIRTVDHAVGEIVAALDDAGILDETVLAVTSDHGVLFGECGCYGGHISAHYRCIHVPLIMRAPAVVPAGARLTGYVYPLDLGPTLCSMAGAAVPSGYHGLSLLSALENAEFGGREYIVSGHGHYTAQRTLLCGNWKLNRTWHGGFWEFDDTELYDIANDAFEHVNHAADEPETILRLNRRMRQWLDEYRPDHADPLARVACEEPPGYIRFGQELRAQVRRGDLRPPDGYAGRWM
jgi:arylsulfatase A-like enzyme